MRKYIVSLLILPAMVCPAAGQGVGEPDEPLMTGRSPLRTEFISYDGSRDKLENNVYRNSQYYKELEIKSLSGGYAAEIEIPVLWLDREIFLHTEGFEHSEISVNGRKVEAEGMDVLPYEVNITPYITDGVNIIGFRKTDPADMPPVVGARYERSAFVYSQPRLRIEDFTITAEPDSLNKYGILTIRVALANSYNFPETINVGYDIYDPKGKLQYFDNRDVEVQGVLTGGRDTLEFKEFIYGTPTNLWTPDKPALYHGMLIVKHGRRITEYIPYRVGFGRTEVMDGRLLRNGKAVEVKAARYNSAADRKTTASELARLKKAGINTIMVDYPQPYWFYELTDETGLYVFDSTGLGSGSHTDTGRTPQASPANDPRLAPHYLFLTESMFARSRNHTSIVGWSLAGEHGNGYNLYKTYLWLKENEPSRPVIYNGAEGEWNSDMEPLHAVGAREILDKPAATQKTTKR